MRDPTPKELEEYKKSLELDASKCHDIGCDYCIAYGYPYFGKKFPLQSHAA